MKERVERHATGGPALTAAGCVAEKTTMGPSICVQRKAVAVVPLAFRSAAVMDAAAAAATTGAAVAVTIGGPTRAPPTLAVPRATTRTVNVAGTPAMFERSDAVSWNL